MTRNPFGWDYPPGVSESDLPGNTPADHAWDRAYCAAERRLTASDYAGRVGRTAGYADLIDGASDGMIDGTIPRLDATEDIQRLPDSTTRMRAVTGEWCAQKDSQDVLQVALASILGALDSYSLGCLIDYIETLIGDGNPSPRPRSERVAREIDHARMMLQRLYRVLYECERYMIWRDAERAIEED